MIPNTIRMYIFCLYTEIIALSSWIMVWEFSILLYYDILQYLLLLYIIVQCSSDHLIFWAFISVLILFYIIPICLFYYFFWLDYYFLFSRSTKMGVQVLKLLSRCPNIETLILKGNKIELLFFKSRSVWPQ